MNRYVVEGVARDLRNGLRVAYVAPARRCREVCAQIGEHISWDRDTTVRAVNGRQRVDHTSGGFVQFVASGNGYGIRGLAVDVLVVDDPAVCADPARRLNLLPALSGSPIQDLVLCYSRRDDENASVVES